MTHHIVRKLSFVSEPVCQDTLSFSGVHEFWESIHSSIFHPSNCMFLPPSIHSSIYLSSVTPSIRLSIRLSIHSSIVHLSVYHSINSSVHLPIHRSIHPSIRPGHLVRLVVHPVHQPLAVLNAADVLNIFHTAVIHGNAICRNQLCCVCRRL